MRTTLTIEDEIAMAIERLQARTGSTFRGVVNDLLKAGLQAHATEPASRPYKGKVYSMEPVPGIDLSQNMNALASALEEEAILGKG